MKIPFLFCLLLFSQCFSVYADETNDNDINCRRRQLLEAQQQVVEQMSAEEIEQALATTQEQLVAFENQRQNSQDAQELAQLLTQVQQQGKVKIEDCTELDIQEDNEEAQILINRIRFFCENSPQNFWAEITATGEVKFSFSYGTNNGIKSLTVGGSSNITLSYRGHELKLTGGASRASVGEGHLAATTTKYDAAVDYSIDLGIANLESFIKWKTNFESTDTPIDAGRSVTSLRRNSVDLGLRYIFVDTDTLTIKVGSGLGFNHMYQVTPSETIDRVRPSATLSYDFLYRPTDNAKIFLNAHAQRDIAGESPSTLVGGKAGASFSLGPVGLGAEYGVDFDSARTGTKVNHQVMFTLGASLNPNDWRDKSEVETQAHARARENQVWQEALERSRRARQNKD